MKRARLVTALRTWCRKNGKTFRVDTVAGKGSHIKIYINGASTIVKDGELSPLYVQVVLKQFGISKNAI